MFMIQLMKAFIQTHILNLPIGLNTYERARDEVRVEGIKWKVHLKSRWKSGVGITSIEILDLFKISRMRITRFKF